MHLDNIIIIRRCGVCLTLGAVSVHIKYAYIVRITLRSARHMRTYIGMHVTITITNATAVSRCNIITLFL